MPLVFALTTALAVWLSHLAFRQPNPKVSTPTISAADNKWESPLLEAIEKSIMLIHPLLGFSHALLAVFFPNPPPSLICPNPRSLNNNLFSWSGQSIGILLAMALFALGRLACFRALGPDFVYQINRPKKLVTTGPYKWIRHPGYTAVIGCWVANVALLLRPDGVFGCFLPASIAGWGNVFALVHSMTWSVWLASVIPPRVTDEEEMLRREFGSAYEEWERRTWRFVPFVY
jgi:protein-S-isoprenylcysteine O-methyltransferase Ste14